MTLTPFLATSSTAVAAASPSWATTMMTLAPWVTMLLIWSFWSLASWLASCEMTSKPLSVSSFVISSRSRAQRSVAKSENDRPILTLSAARAGDANSDATAREKRMSLFTPASLRIV